MNVFIETLKNSDMRTRYDESTFQRKRSFKVSYPYPYAYGFIIGSNKKDEECLDCYVLTNETLIEGQPLECEPVFMIEVYEGSEEDHKVIMKTADYEIDNEELVENTIKSFITRIFSENPEVTIRFGGTIAKEETIQFINSNMRE
jgi:inorganic pyrophosphatase